MADNLELELRSIEGEGPSPDFVANLRKQVVAEMTKSAVAVDDDLVISIDLRPEQRERAMTKTRWILAGVAAAAIALIVGVVVLSGDSDESGLDTISDSQESTTTTSEPEESTTSSMVADPTTTISGSDESTTAGSATFAGDATVLTQEFSPLEAGTYRVDTLGTPLSFTSEETISVRPNSRAFFVLGHEFSQGPDDREIVFMRLTALWDPAQPNALPEDLGDGWPAEDFVGWLDNLGDGVVASNREETTLGGLDATRVDLEVDQTACGENSQFCVGLGTNELVNSKVLSPGSKYRIWVVDQEDQAPLAVIVGISDETDSDWFDTAERVLSTLEFGDIAPNPILRLSAGPAELLLLGGIQIELPMEATVTQGGETFGGILLDGQFAHTEFLASPLDFDGNTLETPDELVAVLRDSNTGTTEVTEIEPTTIGGIEARVFELVDAFSLLSKPSLKRTQDEADVRGWGSPPRGQMWLLEHPERGLLMITAEALEGDTVDTVFPLILTQTEQILGSLEFIDLG